MDYFILLGFGISGLYIWFTPTEKLLKNDHGFGKIYYLRAKDKKHGLNEAREFYNLLGKAFVLVSVLGFTIKLFFALL